MATHSSILAWKIPWTQETGRLQSMGSQRVGHDWATSLTHLNIKTNFLCSLIFTSIKITQISPLQNYQIENMQNTHLNTPTAEKKDTAVKRLRCPTMWNLFFFPHSSVLTSFWSNEIKQLMVKAYAVTRCFLLY